MVQLIVGKKGKGKTKQLLDKVNGAIKAATIPHTKPMNSSVLYVVLYLRIMICRKCIWTAS